MWVESDQLMPSGEALVRQLLYGQRFFKSRFGAISKTFWLPDSFGYNPQIPQLARLAGCEFFFTQKMSWSQFNEYPLTSFLWQGQDKTQIACHFCPQNTYTAQASVDDVLNTWRNHKSLQASPTGLLTFGNGDGGGGPLAPMLENLRRCRAVAEQSGEIPKVHMGTSVDEFYQDLLDRTDGGKTLPTWCVSLSSSLGTGELYLELHRGTATSHGSIKRHNRKTEILLHDIEFVGTLASLLGKNGKGGKGAYSYPKDALDPLWEDALLCQFHDVLPGSAIGMLYAGIAEKGADLLDSALHALVPGSSSLAEFSSADSLVALDTTSQPRREIVKVPLAAARSLHDAAIQRSHDGEAYVLIQTERGLLSRARTTDEVAAQKLSARGALSIRFDWSGFDFGAEVSPEDAARIVGSDHVLSTDKLQVTISDQGRITSILDKELNRELILEGKTAGFVIFEDRPLNWDAWDVGEGSDAFHLETKEEVNASSVKVIEDGPLRAAVVATFHLGQSRIKASFPSLSRENALSLVRFDTEVEWHERHRFLKWEIPLNLTPTGDMATFENQFGFCQRPTHRNTTWDRAKFEVVAHRFADLSEFGYGVSLLNDCKYGHAAEGSLLRLSLLRAATLPDAEQDQGFHTFSFAGKFRARPFSDVPAVARSFNYPLHLRRVSSKSLASLSLALAEPFRLTGARNLVLDTVKRGEDDHFAAASIAKHEATVVCRFYEAFGGHGKGVFETSLPIEEAAVCDLLERELEPVEVVKTTDERSGRTTYSMALELRGFEVKSLKLKVAPTGKKA
ncbi:SPOSA6832_03996, partial [Sporobolomyces salmonicolor]